MDSCYPAKWWVNPMATIECYSDKLKGFYETKKVHIGSFSMATSINTDNLLILHKKQFVNSFKLEL